MSDDPADKRRNPRLNALKVVVRIPSVDRFRTHYLKDISEGGLFVKAEKVLPVGALLSLELWPPGWDEAVELSAKVIRSTDAATASLEGKPCGMAVQFVSVPVEVDRQLKSLVEAYQGEEAEAAVDPMSAQIEAMIQELAEARAKVSLLETQLAEARGQAEAFSEEVHKLQREEAEARANSVQLAQERTELERRLKEATTRAAAEESALKQQLDGARLTREQLQREMTQQREEGRSVLAQVTLEKNELDRKLKEGTAKATAEAANLREQIEAVRRDMAQQREETRQQKERADRVAADLKEREGREQGLKRLLNRAAPRKPSTAPDRGGDDVVEISDTGEWSAVPAPATPASPTQAKRPPSSPPGGDVDLEIELSELDLDEEIDMGFSAAASPSPMLSSMAAAAESSEDFARFSVQLKARTRLMVRASSGGQRPAGPDENHVFLLLGASPTFGTLVSQAESKMNEDRLRHVLYDLYVKQLIELQQP